MADENSTTYWINQLKAGNPQAPREVCDRCWRLVVHQARQRLQNNQVVGDAEDVAVSVFDTFFRGTAEGKYADMADGNELRRLFLVLTRNKAVEHARKENRQKRGGGVLKEPATADLASAEPDPALEAEWNDQCQLLLRKLDDNLLCEIALLRLEGLTNKEIADKVAIPLRTVERKLALIRELWANPGDDHEKSQE